MRKIASRKYRWDLEALRSGKNRLIEEKNNLEENKGVVENLRAEIEENWQSVSSEIYLEELECQVLYFLFVHLRLTDGYISVFQIEAKRWMPFPFGFRAHSALSVLYSVFLISLPIFSGLCCGAYACRMRAINSPCWANRSYIGCTAARNLAFSSSSSSVTSMPAARRSLSDSASCCAQILRSTLALSRAHRRMISG